LVKGLFRKKQKKKKKQRNGGGFSEEEGEKTKNPEKGGSCANLKGGRLKSFQ